MRHEEVAGVLNLFPEVRWDRCMGDLSASPFEAFGWIDRDDGRSDFLTLIFYDNEPGTPLAVYFTTSSARYSEEFARRLRVPDGRHVPCRRVEDVLGSLVHNKIELLEAGGS